MGIEMEEAIIQKIADFALTCSENFLKADKTKAGCYLGDGEVLFEGHAIRIQVYPVKGDRNEFTASIIEKRKVLSPYSLVMVWQAEYARYRKIEYSRSDPSPKHMKMFSNMLREFSANDLEGMIRFFVQFSDSIPGYSGEPTIEGFMGFRVTIHKMYRERAQVFESKKQADSEGVKL